MTFFSNPLSGKWKWPILALRHLKGWYQISFDVAQRITSCFLTFLRRINQSTQTNNDQVTKTDSMKINTVTYRRFTFINIHNLKSKISIFLSFAIYWILIAQTQKIFPYHIYVQNIKNSIKFFINVISGNHKLQNCIFRNKSFCTFSRHGLLETENLQHT